jgi:hypothetical protein
MPCICVACISVGLNAKNRNETHERQYIDGVVFCERLSDGAERGHHECREIGDVQHYAEGGRDVGVVEGAPSVKITDETLRFDIRAGGITE